MNDPPLRHASKPASGYRNDPKCYKDLCDLLTRARFEGQVPFEAIDDPTRPVSVWDVHRSVSTFLRWELEHFLRDYQRDLQQSQPCHVEVVGEKNTIANIIEGPCAEFCIPMTLGRGYASTPPKKAMVDRFLGTGKERLVILLLTDFDPEGEDIARNFAQSLRDDFGIFDVTGIKVALTKDQIEELSLPPNFRAKEGSSRRKGFVAKHGENVYELEAIPPERMQDYLRDAIEQVLDLGAYADEMRREEEDAAALEARRRLILRTLSDTNGAEEVGNG